MKSNLVFLNSKNPIIKNTMGLEICRKIANNILGKNENNTVFTDIEQERVFNHCKNYLEVNGKNHKEYSLDSSYSMNRSLLVMFVFLLMIYICFKISVFQRSDGSRILVLIGLIIILCKRAVKYSQLRAHAVIQHYEALHRKNFNNTVPTQNPSTP